MGENLVSLSVLIMLCGAVYMIGKHLQKRVALMRVSALIEGSLVATTSSGLSIHLPGGGHLYFGEERSEDPSYSGVRWNYIGDNGSHLHLAPAPQELALNASPEEVRDWYLGLLDPETGRVRRYLE